MFLWMQMFSFGLTALEKFRDRLVEWPQYCNHILQISHMREAHGSLVEFIQRALARVSSESNTSHTVTQPEAQHSSAQVPSTMPIVSTVENMEVEEKDVCETLFTFTWLFVQYIGFCLLGFRSFYCWQF
jgi:hypothetical protein